MTSTGSVVAAALLLAAFGCSRAPGRSGGSSSPEWTGSETVEPSRYAGPVIDMHLRAMKADEMGPPPMGMCPGFMAEVAHDPASPWGPSFGALFERPACTHPIWSARTDAELRDVTLATLKRLNVRGVLSGPRERVAQWKTRAPDRIIAGHRYRLGRESHSAPELRAAFSAGEFEVLAEVTSQDSGVAPDDPSVAEVWAIAEKLDIPVGLGLGLGLPGSPYLDRPKYRARLHDPHSLEEILIAHPRLRVYLMHAAYPRVEALKSMLYAYPQLYVGTGALQALVPRAEYHALLEELTRAGFGKRIMFGSDQMIWPGLIEEGIEAVNTAPLSVEDKRRILYENAARFLRLEP